MKVETRKVYGGGLVAVPLYPTKEIALTSYTADLVVSMRLDEAIILREGLETAIKKISFYSNEKLHDHAREIEAEMKARGKEAGIDDEAE